MFNNRRRKIQKIKKIVAGLSAVAALLLICAFIIMHWRRNAVPVITIQVSDASMYADETIPAFAVSASASKETEELILDAAGDKNQEYQVKDFLDAINQGQNYQIDCEYDSESGQEGEYPIKVTLSEEMLKKIEKEWKNKIKVEIQEGILHVKNTLGEWDGEKFLRRDGTYVTSEFLRINEETYYFDEEGKKVTGKQEICGVEYYFKKDGKFDEEKNRINPTLPMIALTFDDGPSKYTEKLLNALEEYDVRATFFMVGQNVKKRPEVVKKMKEIGCEIGNHTTDHKRLTELEKDGIIAQVEGTNEAIQTVIGEGASVIRPPYGAVNDLVKSSVNQPLVFWNVDTLDWELQDAQKVKNYTLDIIKDGDIILMHDLYETTVDATIAMIPKLLERGYQIVTVSEMAKARGIEMKSGEEYYFF